MENVQGFNAAEFCRQLSALLPEKAAGYAYRLPLNPDSNSAVLKAEFWFTVPPGEPPPPDAGKSMS